MMKMRDEEA